MGRCRVSGGVNRHDLACAIREVTDGWEEPLDEVHDVPQIINAVLAYLATTTRLEPWESIALSVATSMLNRGEEVTPNVAAVCVGALERIAREVSR